MLCRRIWLSFPKRRDRWGEKKRWKVEREGWFLFGLLPVYIRDLSAEQIEL